MGEGDGAVKNVGDAGYHRLMAKDPKFDAEAARQDRLAAALRANLQRRKARDRAASEPPQTNDRAASEPPPETKPE